MLDTKCELCSFLDGQKCKLSKLEKFQEQGIVEGDPPEIKGRVCVFHRPASWLEKYGDLAPYQIIQETKLKIIAYIEYGGLESLKKAVTNLDVSKIIVLCDPLPQQEKIEIEKICVTTGKPWLINESFAPDKYAAMDYNINKDKFTEPYYLYLGKNNNFNPDALSKLDNYVNTELKQFLLLDGQNWELALTMLHKRWKKDIKEELIANGADNMILTYEKLRNIECGPRTADQVLRSEMSS